MKKVSTPLTDETIDDLEVGDEVLISGVIYTMRDAAHARVAEIIKNKGKLPFDLRARSCITAAPRPQNPAMWSAPAGPRPRQGWTYSRP